MFGATKYSTITFLAEESHFQLCAFLHTFSEAQPRRAGSNLQWEIPERNLRIIFRVFTRCLELTWGVGGKGLKESPQLKPFGDDLLNSQAYILSKASPLADEIWNKFNKVKNEANRWLQQRIILTLERERVVSLVLYHTLFFLWGPLFSTFDRFQTVGNCVQ